MMKGIVKVICKYIVYIYGLPIFFLSMLKKEYIFSLFFKAYNILTGDIVEFTYLDQIAKKVPKSYFSDVAIVMQGPIRWEGEFTEKVMEWYRLLYPDIPIVISTWDGDIKESFLQKCKKLNITLIQGMVPEYAGYGHVNYQLLSSLRGIRYIKRLGSIKYVFKCRTDQIYRRPNFIGYFINLLNTFPINDTKQNERIVFLGERNSYKWIPFHLCDWMTFGDLDDLEKLYNRPMVKKEYMVCTSNDLLVEKNLMAKYEMLHKIESKPSCIRKMEKFMDAETFIIKSYIGENIGINSNDMLKVYHLFLQKYAVVVDSKSLLFYWPKYNGGFREYNCMMKDYGSLDFAAWLKIYNKDIKSE